MPFAGPVAERIARSIDASGECHLWLAALDGHGYGMAYAHGKAWRAHRLVWTLTHGPIPPGALLMHHCDVRRCVNPLHLSVATDADNLADMVRKGRQSRGSARPHAKLDEPAVRDARLRYAARAATMGQLAREYGVTAGTMRAAIKGLTWGHVR